MLHLTSLPVSHPLLARARFHDAKWLHHRVMDLFGDLGGGPQARNNGDVLFRFEPQVGDGRVLVQSSVEPVVDGVRTTPLTPALAKLEPGLPVRFLLHANAVRTVNRTHDGVVKQHRADVPPHRLRDWVCGRIGGALTDVDLEEPTRHDRRRGKAKLAVVRFAGTAAVDDPQTLTRAIRDGIGRAKAYGCGLLTVGPVR